MGRRAVYTPGQTFRECTLIRETEPHVAPNGCSVRRGLWQCRCGDSFEATFGNVKGGQVQSCGCLKRETTIARSTKHGYSPARNPSQLYRFWQSMKDRCCNPDCDSYANYGGRGISCQWPDAFEPFLEWFVATFKLTDIPKGLSMDRINNDGDYRAGNLRLADRFVQANNRRNNRVVTYRDERYTVAQLARKHGIKSGTLSARLNAYGYTVDEAVAMGFSRRSPHAR